MEFECIQCFGMSQESGCIRYSWNIQHENVVPWGFRETENPVFVSWWPLVEYWLETYVGTIQNTGKIMKELPLRNTFFWGTQKIYKRHNLACVLMGPTLSAMGNMGMDTRLSCGDRVRSGFLEVVMSKPNSDKTSEVIHAKGG